jgi:hypothetical protein
LVKIATCELCKGLFRLAHTLLECGHTFCKPCIFDYIARFKGKKSSPKCPNCQTTIDQALKKSIFRDTYKQAIVDILSPESVEADKLIIEKAIQFFPECGLSSLVDELASNGPETRTSDQLSKAANEQFLAARRLP